MDECLVGEILAVVRNRTGIDFAPYRKGTVRRRIQNRMIALGVEIRRHIFLSSTKRRMRQPVYSNAFVSKSAGFTVIAKPLS